MSKIRNKFKRVSWWRMALIVAPPFIVAYFLFAPFEIVELRKFGENTYTPQSYINASLSTAFLAELFPSSLGLGWYKICWRNEGALTINGETLLYDESAPKKLIPWTLELDEEIPGTFFIKIIEIQNDNIISTKELSAKPGEKNCSVFSGSADGISYQTRGTTTASLGRAGGAFIKGAQDLGGGRFSTTVEFDFKKLSLTATNYFPAILARTYILFLLWGSMILLLREIWKFTKKPMSARRGQHET